MKPLVSRVCAAACLAAVERLPQRSPSRSFEPGEGARLGETPNDSLVELRAADEILHRDEGPIRARRFNPPPVALRGQALLDGPFCVASLPGWSRPLVVVPIRARAEVRRRQ